MKTFLQDLRRATGLTLILGLLCCGLYPLTVWAIAQLAFPSRAQGSLLTDADGTVRGSALIGQGFTAEKYFHPRPSAAGTGYDAANSGGSNLGPTSTKLRDSIRDRIGVYRRENRLGAADEVPADAVTASGSGLDPQISLRNAELQLPRVARARRMEVEHLRALVRVHTKGADLGMLGEPGVNVLELNLALDRSKPSHP